MVSRNYYKACFSILACFLHLIAHSQDSDCTLFESYDDPTNWTWVQQGPEIDCPGVPPGDIQFQNGVQNWNLVRDGGYDTRIYRELGFTLCESWIAEVDIKIIAGGSASVGPFSLSVLGLTSGSEPMIGYYVGNNIIQADQDGIVTYLTSSSQNNWKFRVGLRDGTEFELATTIPINPVYGVTYHLKVQRINSTSGFISVTSDDFTPAFSASSCFDIPSTITDLTHLQHGNTPIGTCERTFTGEIDNLCIQNCTSNSVDILPDDLEFSACSGEPIPMNITATGSGITYSWTPASGVSNPNILNPTITVTQSTTYTLTATNGCGQTESISIYIEVGAINTVEINGESQITICPNSPYTPDLEINTVGNTYLWSPVTGLSDPIVLNPEITVSEPTSYTLTATNECAGSATFQLSVTLADPLNFELEPEITICKGDTVEIPGVLNSDATVSWSESNTLNTLDIPNPLAFPSTTTTYHVSVSDQCQSVNQSIHVIVNEAPSISGTSDLDICVGDTGYANIHNTGNYEVTSWNWTPTSGLKNATIANPGIFNPNAITYQVSATNSCGTDVFEVHLKTFDLDANLDLDSIICPGEPILLSANGAASYSWFPTDAMTHPFDSVTTAYIYTDQTIQLQLSGGTCVKTFTDFVAVYDDIGFTHLDAVHLLPGEDYNIAPLESQYNIVFNGSTLLSFNSDTTFALTYTDTNGCEFYLYLPVIIEPALYVPNGFTPDGDGLNDIFKPIGVNIETFEIQIFNREGKLVFQSNSLNTGWNGGIDGYYCPNGIYNYLIKYSYHTTEVKVKRGFVTLLR